MGHPRPHLLFADCMSQLNGRRRTGIVPGLVLVCALLVANSPALALNPSLTVDQYAHTSWTVREGYSLGAVFAMTQTPDAYLWLGGEFGLFRFDGGRFVRWEPPAGQKLPDKPYSLLATRDGALWIGTFAGLVSWNGTELTRYPQLDNLFVTSLLEDREGTVWAGVLGKEGQLCAIRSGRAQCHLQGGGFGTFVWSLAEDGSGVLWAAAETGLWRWKPGPPRRYETPGMRLGDLSTSEDGRLLVGVQGSGLEQLAGDKLERYLIRRASSSGALLPDRNINSNKLLRDRNGGLWIGTMERGLIHVHAGQADAFTKADGLSGNVSCSLFEDREGNIWFASSRGLDRFRELPVITVSAKQGLSSDTTKSVLASTDGGVWVASHDGLTRWKDGRFTVFRKASGLPDDETQSLFQDFRGRIWVTTKSGLAYFKGDRFVAVSGLPSEEVTSIAGDEAGNLWFSGNRGLSRWLNGRFIEHLPWSSLGRQQQAKVVADKGGVWLAFWIDGGVLYVKDGQIRASYTTADGLGKGHVAGLRLDREGAVWAATEEGGLSRIKDGRISTLTAANGLPCNTIHWSIEDDSRSLWMYTGCGLIRIAHSELDAWLADPARKIETKVWDAADGVRLNALSPAYYNPPVAKSADGKLWFRSGEGVQVVDPNELPVNTIPPPVYIEHVTADRKTYDAINGLRLPPLIRDLSMEFTALSLVAPEKVRFRYRLEGHDHEWQEAGDRRQAFYMNLAPGSYRFRVMASNNSGVWNEEGALLDFSIAPAFYQTNWFRLAFAVLLLALLWSGFQLHTRQLRREEKRLREVIEGIPAMAFSVHPDGSPDLINQHWLNYMGFSGATTADGPDWEAAIHPIDAEKHINKWRAALASGEPFVNEARHRSASGEYRWFLARAVPVRDKQGKIVRWYGCLTDIEERKRAEEERERLRKLETELAHTNRVSMLGELTASLAHEINQPIAAMVASAGAGLRWLGRDHPEVERAREGLRRIKDDGKRAAEIITRLRAFYRKGVSTQRELLDVNEVVGEMLVLLRREADRHSVAMKTELAADLLPVRADRVQLQQVLMNLMLNAIEAIGEAGGELIIRTRSAEGELVMSVSDTGVGLPADNLEQIFSAFFTTKAAGTGMGLAISQTIVESHGGRLWAEANAARGATFHFTLPVPAAQ
jgi:PAS domain S-box-containing protein